MPATYICECPVAGGGVTSLAPVCCGNEINVAEEGEPHSYSGERLRLKFLIECHS
jgi:hypothetical protein